MCSSQQQTKVVPDVSSTELVPDVLATRFYPPIKHVSNDNPWLQLLTPHQLVEIDGAFRKFDRDGDGHIEPKEIRKVMSNLGCPMSEKEAQALIAGVDTDGNGMIEFDEFIGIMAARMLKENGDEELEQAVSLFAPLDGSEFISMDTVRKALCEQGSQKLGDAEMDALMAELPVDSQGRVRFDDFRQARFWQVPLVHGREKRPPPRAAEPEAIARTDMHSGGPSSG